MSYITAGVAAMLSYAAFRMRYSNKVSNRIMKITIGAVSDGRSYYYSNQVSDTQLDDHCGSPLLTYYINSILAQGHLSTRKYVILHDGELGDTDSIRWDLYDEGFDLLWDSARSRRQAIHYMEMFYSEYAKFEPIPVPISFRESYDFVNQNHRHHVAPQGMKFTLAVSNGRKIIGVIIAGRPVSRHRDDGLTLELTTVMYASSV